MILQRSFQSTAIALAYAITFVSAKASLYLTLSGSEYIDAVEDFRVVATLTNTGYETIRVLNDPRSALSDMPTDIFTISNEVGDSPIFTGIAAKYVPKVAIAMGDYTTLIPGQSVEVEHNLASRYDFSSSGASVYTIYLSNEFRVIDSFNPKDVVTLHADYGVPHIARISQVGIIDLFDQRYFNTTIEENFNMDTAGVMVPSFTGCSNQQQNLIKAAAVQAQKYASGAYEFLRSNRGNNKRYNTWFGSFDSTRYNTVLQAFQTINGNNYLSYTYDCSTCHMPSYFAYVTFDKFGTVYLCPAFWRAPPSGTDSKGGTIVHESSHFNKNGGTRDHGYGHSKCMNLAKKSPGIAIHNADSYEYFSENTA